MILFALLLSFLISIQAHAATTYYVATTGSDSTGTGTDVNPWRNPQKCVDAGSPLVAGDTCLVKPGTYTDTDNNGIVVYIRSTAPAGTPSAPITLKSETPLGAVLSLPNFAGTTTGIYISQSNYVIEGFDVSGGNPTGASASASGITVSAVSNTVIRRNRIHGQGRLSCINVPFGMAGMFLNSSNGVTVEYNRLDGIGRLRNGENGCVTDKYQHDHGIYSSSAVNVTIRHNVIYDVNRGYPLHFYQSGGGTHINVFIYNNTISGQSPTGQPAGQVLLCNTLNNVQIKNNIFESPPLGYVVQYCISATTNTNVVFDHNLTNGTLSNFVNPSPAMTGYTYTNNITNTSPNMVSASQSSPDPSLLAGSAAIDAGTSVGEPSCGSATDIGAFETCGPLSASMNGATLEVTMAQAFPPIQIPNSTGWSISCSGAGCGTAAVSSATKKTGSDSVVSLNISGLPGGTCSGGDTYTVSYNASTGSATDSISIGNAYNQKTFTFSSFPVTNACTGSTPAPPGGPYLYYKLDGDVLDSSGNGRTGTQNGGSFTAAKYGSGLQLTPDVVQNVASVYGSGVNPSTQDITIVASFFINTGDEGLTRTFAGAALGTNQRLYISTINGSWGLGIQGSVAGSGTSDLSVVPGWNRICLRLNSSTDTATLYRNGVAGTGTDVVKAYTSYTLASNIYFGAPTGFSSTVAPGTTIDEAKIYNSLVGCDTDYTAWDPPATPVGVQNQVGHRFQSVYLQSGSPVNLGTGANQSQQVIKSGGVAIVFQVDCTNVAPCPGALYQLRYSLDGVNYNNVVPDIPTSDGVSMWGPTSDATINRFSAACPVTSALGGGCVSGDTTITSSQSSVARDLAQNSSYTIRYIVRIANPPVSSVYFKLYQSGTALPSYTPSTGAMISVVPPQASAN